jgi:two-component system, response regulator PdtaR
MTRSLRIAIADDESLVRNYLGECLVELGHIVASVSGTGKELVTNCRALPPDLVIADIKMPDMDGIRAAREITADVPVPVILVSAHHDSETVLQAEQAGVFAFLVKPIECKDLGPAICVAMTRFEELRDSRKEAAELRQALEDRKVIERAKGILMSTTGIDEREAFQRLQKLANDKGKRLVDAARMIVSIEAALDPQSKT